MDIIILQDKEGNETAEIEVQSIKHGLLSGRILKKAFSPEQEKEFKEYIDIVNNQVFSLLDEIEEKISSNGYKIKNKDWQIFDVQVFEEQISLRMKCKNKDS